jgi:hypothetical protein
MNTLTLLQLIGLEYNETNLQYEQKPLNPQKEQKRIKESHLQWSKQSLNFPLPLINICDQWIEQIKQLESVKTFPLAFKNKNKAIQR